MAIVRKRVVVTGRVQGVLFRDSTRRVAQRHGVGGWVRNTRDGAVEAVFEGAPEAVERLVAFCREGPPGACVDEIEVRDEQPEGAQSFRVTG
jgi:acylphosphatase